MSFDINALSNAHAQGQMKPADIAQQVQAMFLEMLLKSMEDSVGAEGGLYGNSSSSEIYRGMLRQEMAAALSGDMDSSLRDQIERALIEQSAKAPGSAHAVSPHPGVAAPGAYGHHRGAVDHYRAALPVDGRVTSREGWRSDPFTGESRYHRGTDIAAPEGSPIRAVASGRVVESGQKGGYGNTVVIETNDGRKMLYAHNLENRVRVGDRVRAGDLIALVGSTGRSTGPHVHFEVTD